MKQGVRLFRKSLISIIGLVMVLVVYPIRVINDVWQSVILQQPVSVKLISIPEAYAKVLVTAERVLEIFFPGVAAVEKEVRELSESDRIAIEQQAGIKFDPELDKAFTFYISRVDDAVAGYAVEDRVKGKWGIMHYMLFFNIDGTIRDVVVLEYQEKRGRPVAKERFRKQFRGKTIDDRIQLRKDIRGVSGATISSKGMTDGIRKMVHVFNRLYQD